MIIILLLAIVALSFVLIKAADVTLAAINKMSSKLQVGGFAVSAIVLTMGTSFPELSIGVLSALQRAPEVLLGVVIGSNIANISLVAGIGAVSAGSAQIRGGLARKNFVVSLITGLVPIVLVADGALSRSDGVVLLGMYLVYAFNIFGKELVKVGRSRGREVLLVRYLRVINHAIRTTKSAWARLALGVGLLIVSADLLVRVAKVFGESLGIPTFVVGLIILAVGTSLPEMAFAVRSLRNHESGVFFGNILGSVITNSTFVVGVTALISPISVPDFEPFLIASFFFITTAFLFWYFSRTKHGIVWWEALLLVTAYLVFALVEFLK